MLESKSEHWINVSEWREAIQSKYNFLGNVESVQKMVQKGQHDKGLFQCITLKNKMEIDLDMKSDLGI